MKSIVRSQVLECKRTAPADAFWASFAKEFLDNLAKENNRNKISVMTAFEISTWS